MNKESFYEFDFEFYEFIFFKFIFLDEECFMDEILYVEILEFGGLGGLFDGVGGFKLFLVLVNFMGSMGVGKGF